MGHGLGYLGLLQELLLLPFQLVQQALDLFPLSPQLGLLVRVEARQTVRLGLQADSALQYLLRSVIRMEWDTGLTGWV